MAESISSVQLADGGPGSRRPDTPPSSAPLTSNGVDNGLEGVKLAELSAAGEPDSGSLPSARAVPESKALMTDVRGTVTLKAVVADDSRDVSCRARAWRRAKCVVMPWVRLVTSVPGDLMSLRW